MWKYILILLFVILAIREINLMNQSLYVTPDNQIIVQDKTTLTRIKTLIKEIKNEEFMLPEPTLPEHNETNKTVQKAQKPQPASKPTPIVTSETNKTVPDHNRTKKTVIKKAVSSVSKTRNIQKTESKKHPAPVILPASEPKNPYEERFENAQKRIEEILKSMRKSR